ncbi:MAG: hypothetical protein JG781_78 [Peptococcaceae bacterium]|nr:hypothetical protein [Peptococcaceae bacterium]
MPNGTGTCFRGVEVYNKQGFTFLEVMVITVIIGILTAVAMPSVGDVLAEQKLKAAARTLASDLRKVQATAISQETPVRVNFDLLNNYYKASIGTANILGPKYLPADVKMVYAQFNGSAQFYFNALGAAENGTVTLALTNNPSKMLYVIVYRSGRIRISPTSTP